MAMSAIMLNSYEAKAADAISAPSEVMMTIRVNQSPKDSVSVIEKGVKEVVAKQLYLEESAIKPTSDLVKDLGADSLDVVEIVMSLENKYNIKFSDDELNSIKNVGDILTIIEKRKK